jgi:amidohydrolase
MTTSAARPATTHSGDPRLAGLIEAARALQPRTVALRRQVHKRPELGLRLPLTQAAVLHALEGLPLEITTGKSTDSVVAVLHGARPGPTVLLRADMDALPLTEQTGCAFASEVHGTMHACGHDTHVAMLASAARLLCARKDALHGHVVFMFQPGEEGHHGAKHMIDEGVLGASGLLANKAFALHITSTVRSGVVTSRPGPIMAAADVFRVRVIGRGGHASQPHKALDPVPAAAAMVGALQTMITRRIATTEPAVLTVAKIAAGTTSNIIPELAELEGTIRTFSETTRTEVHTEAKRICEHTAAAYGCSAMFQIERGYPITVNDADVAGTVLGLASSVLGQRYSEPMAEPMMGAEDFSYVTRQIPGTMAFLGACPPSTGLDEAAPNHSNRVLFDEAAMEHGVAMYAAFALDALR